jgi:hypothetical protein
MIKGLHQNAYRCRDSEQTRTFYEDFRGCQGDAGQSRHRRHPNRTPSRCLSGDALSVHPRRANREYPWSLKRRFTIRASISPPWFQWLKSTLSAPSAGL